MKQPFQLLLTLFTQGSHHPGHQRTEYRGKLFVNPKSKNTYITDIECNQMICESERELQVSFSDFPVDLGLDGKAFHTPPCLRCLILCLRVAAQVDHVLTPTSVF